MPEKTDILKFSPRERFASLYQAPERTDFRATVMKPVVQHALTLAFAELATLNVSREQLDGALNFIAIFQNFSEPVQQNKPLPQKTLQALS